MSEEVVLHNVDLFADLDPSERDFLARSFTKRTVAPNQVILWVGDNADEFFIIEHGHVEVCLPDESGKELRLTTLGPDEYFGEIALFDSGRRSSTIRALDSVSLLVLSSKSFHAALDRFPTIAVHLLRIQGGRHRRALEKLRGIRNLNEVLDHELSRWQRIAQLITTTASSRNFLLTHAVAFCAWIVANSTLGDHSWDPYPFPFLCFWASVEAIFLSLFILVSQATQSDKDRLRNELDYQVAMKLHFEIMQIHQKIDSIRERRSFTKEP